MYLKNQARQSSLDPYYHGPYVVLATNDNTVTVHSDLRGRLTVHKNHVRPSQTTEIIVLPSARPPSNDPLELEEVAEPNHNPIQDPLEEGEGTQQPTAVETDSLELPIALRKPFRHKPKVVGNDFVAS